jgi:multidrug efflux pump subunit AcrA (membrane-fusion protein)
MSSGVKRKVVPPRRGRLILEIDVGQRLAFFLASGSSAAIASVTIGAFTWDAVSADITQDQPSNQGWRNGPTGNTASTKGISFYTVRIMLPDSEIARLNGLKLVPGMPVETFIQTGDRTAISYLVNTRRCGRFWFNHNTHKRIERLMRILAR